MLPIPVEMALKKIGHDIRTARLKKRLPMKLLAEMAAISRTTLTKVEKGDPSVAFGIYAAIMFLLEMRLIDTTQIEDEKLPKRVRLPKR